MTPAGAIWIAVALALLATPAGAVPLGQPCVITGTGVHMYKVTVQTPTLSFNVRLRGAPATATVRGDVVELDVSGAIAFKGVVPHKVWYFAKQQITTGQVTMAPGAKFIGDRAHDGELIGRAVLYADDVLPGEDKEPDEAVSPVQVPCDQLSLDQPDGDDSFGLESKTRWHVRKASSVILHSEPRDNAPGVTVATPACDSCLELAGIARRGSWVKLAAQNEGVTAIGWARASRLERIPESWAGGYAYGCSGNHPDYFAIVLYPPGQQPTRRQVRIKAGTPVYSGAQVWAVVPREADFVVEYGDNAVSANIVSAPGIEFDSGVAFVAMSALIFQP